MPGRPPSALIVDDQQALGEVLAERLAMEGFQTTVAGTATEALRSLTSRVFDVAFIDLKLPDMNGTAAALEIRQRYPQTRIVLMTGLAVALNELRTEWTQFDAVLPKPWRPAEMEAVLKSIRGTNQ